MGTPREDSNLFLLAVQQGELTQEQIDDCLRAWRERHEGGALHRVAVEKGYLTEEKLRDLTVRRADASRVDGLVVMACPGCRQERQLTLKEAVNPPVCPSCSRGLLLSAVDSPSVTLKIGVPPEVQSKAADIKNRFGKYVLLGRLGQGGMGEVVKAWDGALRRTVAIKFPRERGPDDIQRLQIEGQGAARLAHPNIATVYEAGDVDGRPFLAMQFIDGQTADDARRGLEGRKGIREIARWIRDAALAVEHAHEAGVIHRDLKPSNLMIDRQGRVYVMDFGLAKLKSGGPDATASGVVLGTPAYMPPEQAVGAGGDRIDARSDVYALGATLYMLVSGRKPYEGESATDILVRLLTQNPAPLREHCPDLPREIEAVIEKAMRREKEDRYASARELADELDRFLADEPVRARPPSITRRLKQKARRHRTVIGVSAVAVALAAALIATLLSRPGPAPVLQRPLFPSTPDTGQAWQALFGRLRTALGADSFDAAAARPLKEEAARAFPERWSELETWLAQEHRLVDRALRDLPRERWLDSKDRAKRYRDWLAFGGWPTDAADRVLAWRGTCTLRVYVHPYAALKGPGVDALPAAERVTPLALEMEAVDGDLELSHPAHGIRRVPLRDLKHGTSYVIEGDWKEPERISLRRDE